MNIGHPDAFHAARDCATLVAKLNALVNHWADKIGVEELAKMLQLSGYLIPTPGSVHPDEWLGKHKKVVRLIEALTDCLQNPDKLV